MARHLACHQAPSGIAASERAVNVCPGLKGSVMSCRYASTCQEAGDTAEVYSPSCRWGHVRRHTRMRIRRVVLRHVSSREGLHFTYVIWSGMHFPMPLLLHTLDNHGAKPGDRILVEVSYVSRIKGWLYPQHSSSQT